MIEHLQFIYMHHEHVVNIESCALKLTFSCHGDHNLVLLQMAHVDYDFFLCRMEKVLRTVLMTTTVSPTGISVSTQIFVLQATMHV